MNHVQATYNIFSDASQCRDCGCHYLMHYKGVCVPVSGFQCPYCAEKAGNRNEAEKRRKAVDSMLGFFGRP